MFFLYGFEFLVAGFVFFCSCDLSSWLLGLCSCDGFEFLVDRFGLLKNMKNIKK